jgi:hypothetical protein
MVPNALPTRRQALASLFSVVLSVIACAALMTAAVVAHAPVAVLPFLTLASIACPMTLAWSAPLNLAVLRTRTTDRDAVAALRRELDGLPEAEHPLGL